MARTSECGEGDGAGCSSSSRNNGQGLATSIKQETLANLDQSSDASLSQEDKDWPFLPTSSTSSNASGNELIQQTVLFGTNVTDMASKEKMEKFLDNSTRFALHFIQIHPVHKLIAFTYSLFFTLYLFLYFYSASSKKAVCNMLSEVQSATMSYT